jgi:Tfp pilus assembly protein PilO
MDITKLSVREKTLVFSGVVILITWIFYQFFWMPQVNYFKENSHSLHDLNNILAQNSKASENPNQIEEKSKSLTSNPLFLKLENKNRNYTSVLLDFVSQQKINNNLEIINFNPAKQDLFKNYKHYPYNVKMRTSYQNLYSFIKLFNNLPILALIDQMNIQKDETLQNSLIVEMIIGIYESN